MQVLRSSSIRFRTVACLLLFACGLSLSGHSQNLLPNPGFEEGTDQPAGWRAPERQWAWSDQAHAGKRALMVEGTGKDSVAWRTERLPLAPGGLYRLRFHARRGTGASGGCIVSGPSRVNHDFRPGDSWQPFSFTFSVPNDVTNDYVRLGHWETKGKVFFDDAELVPVQPVHLRSGNRQLGEGESIQDRVYRFSPQFGWAGANCHRPLWLNRASFNSDRWIFSPGAELVYRFALPGVTQTNARVRVGVNYYISGALQVEAGTDGTAWTPVASLDGRNRPGWVTLPARFFPAREIFLRLSMPGNEGNLQVNGCDYEAELQDGVVDAAGRTAFLEVLGSVPDLVAQCVDAGPVSQRGLLVCSLAVSNPSPQELRLRASLSVPGQGIGPIAEAALKPGQATNLSPGVRVPQPGRYPVEVRVTTADGRGLFAGRADLDLGPLLDPRPGYRLAGSEDLHLWWCESGWKVGVNVPAPDPLPSESRKPVAVSLARGEYETAQVILFSTHPGTRALKSARFGAFRNRRGESAALDARLNEVAYVQVAQPTDDACERGLYPDPLPPLQLPLRLPPSRNCPLWLTIHAPRGTQPGDYSGELALGIDDVTIRVPLAVHVYDFELPRETHLRSALGLGTHEINRYHKLTKPEDKRAVYEKYLQNFADHRISPYSFFDDSPIDIRFVGQGTNKQAKVDFTRFDQAAAKWLDEHRLNSFLLPLRGMGGGTFHSRHLGSLEGFQEGTPEFARLFGDYLGQIERHLRERGWLDKAYTYWFDEPDPKDYDFVVDGMKRIRAAAPGLRRMLTEQPEKDLLGQVEIWCGLTPEWTREKVAARRAAGEEVWWYLCTGPKAPYVTIFIDHPGTEMRLWPWQSWQYGVQGILVWATIYWSSSAAFPNKLQDPWSDPMSYVSGYDFKAGQVGHWGNGDGRFLYPPRRDPNTATEPSLDAPINSIRWENLRDGMEDYEYFWLLQQEVSRVEALNREADSIREAKRLLIVPEEISKDLTHFTTDPRPLLGHRDQVARMIERLRSAR
jgi:hypothetical protein